MTSSSARGWSRRAPASVASGALALAALGAVPTTAGAVSATISYACTAGSLGSFTLPVVLDSTAPQRMITGQSTQLVVSAKATLQAAQAQAIAARPATAVEATLTPRVTFGSTPRDPAITVNRTLIGDTADGVTLSGSSSPSTFDAPATPGSVDITAGDLTGTLRYFNGSTPAGTELLSCTVPSGQPPVIDTIAVASATTTTLTVSQVTSVHGQAVTATARVVASSGSPSGEVAFAVDGIVTRAKVDKAGVASLVLPDAAAGAHSVLATFVPTDVSSFVGSGSGAQTWTVTPAETNLKIPVTGRTTKTVTRVGVRARGEYGTVPTGRVQLKVKRLGKPGKWVKSRRLNDGGAARIRLGVLGTGRYRVAVLYKGDANHLTARKTKTFRVKAGR